LREACARAFRSMQWFGRVNINKSKNMNDKKMTDAEYVKEMIPHHQMAVDMSKELLQTTQNPELKQFAENVIEKQTSEIKQLEKL
jgi:uncharacterized protein (DUF305 family)